MASVELTSEDDAFPIESALLGQVKQGWRAAGPGVQTIRLIFDQPLGPQTHLLGLRGNGDPTHAGSQAAMVAGPWKHVSGNRAATVEFQFAERDARNRKLHSRTFERHATRPDD